MNKPSSKLILLAAGGTGGHMFPAQALAQDLRSRGYRVALVTDRRGERFTPFADDIPTYVLPSAALAGSFVKKLMGIVTMGVGVLKAYQLLKALSPVIVVGFGGYPSVPAVYAAQRMKIPTVIHEQNAILGKANVFLAHKARRIAVAWQHIEGLDPVDEGRAIITGNPVRPEIAALYTQPYPSVEQDGTLRIFVTGGSLGASIFSKVVPYALERLPAPYRARLFIVQQCHEGDIPFLRDFYARAGIAAELKPFFSDMAAQLAKAHLVIARSGAGTVSELTTAGRPAIFVPYPHHADQQQKRNADSVADYGGAWVMTQDGFTKEALSARLETFLQRPEILFRAAEQARSCGRPDAARKLGNLIVEVASGWGKPSKNTQ